MKVSVIVPCYNQSQYLKEALSSVLNQTYANWECIIINDGGLDEAESIAQQFINKDDRFKYYYKDNGGLSSARNYAINKATGLYILPLDADDYMSTNYIQNCILAISKTDVTLVYGKVELFGIKDGIWNLKPYTYRDLMYSNMIHCCVMYRKDMWLNSRGYDETMKDGLEDWEFLVHSLNENDKVIMLDSVRFYYRIKKTSMISSMTKLRELEIKEYVFNKHAKKYFLPFTQFGDAEKDIKKQLNDPIFLLRKLIKSIFKIK